MQVASWDGSRMLCRIEGLRNWEIFAFGIKDPKMYRVVL